MRSHFIAKVSPLKRASNLLGWGRRASAILDLQTPQRSGSKRIADLLDAIRSAPGRIAIALTHRNFRLLWMGALTSSVGTGMQKGARGGLIRAEAAPPGAFFLC